MGDLNQSINHEEGWYLNNSRQIWESLKLAKVILGSCIGFWETAEFREEEKRSSEQETKGMWSQWWKNQENEFQEARKQESSQESK